MGKFPEKEELVNPRGEQEGGVKERMETCIYIENQKRAKHFCVNIIRSETFRMKRPRMYVALWVLSPRVSKFELKINFELTKHFNVVQMRALCPHLSSAPGTQSWKELRKGRTLSSTWPGWAVPSCILWGEFRHPALQDTCQTPAMVFCSLLAIGMSPSPDCIPPSGFFSERNNLKCAAPPAPVHALSG